MTMSAAPAAHAATRSSLRFAGRAAAITSGLTLAAAVRVALNGAGVGPAFLAGTVFGAVLIGLALAAGQPIGRPRLVGVAGGLAGGIVLVLLPVVARPGPSLPLGAHPEPFALWLAVTMVVAVGEEAVLRGTLFDAVSGAAGLPLAIAITSAAFALLHVPLYGWHVVPLDVAVGIWLAGLRLVGRGIAAPTIAHVIADVATWWL